MTKLLLGYIQEGILIPEPEDLFNINKVMRMNSDEYPEDYKEKVYNSFVVATYPKDDSNCCFDYNYYRFDNPITSWFNTNKRNIFHSPNPVPNCVEMNQFNSKIEFMSGFKKKHISNQILDSNQVESLTKIDFFRLNMRVPSQIYHFRNRDFITRLKESP